MPAKEFFLPVWRDGNRIDLLHNGIAYFPALLDAIDRAERTVHLETYIFNLDRTGEAFMAGLIRARQRGVRVRVVIDGFGSSAHAEDIHRRLMEAGVACRVYRPEPSGIRNWRIDPRRLRRLHRKVAVIDQREAYVGGINILDDFEDVPDDGDGPRPRFDFAVRVRGPLVFDIVRSQDRLWLRMSWRKLWRGDKAVSAKGYRRKGWNETYARVSEWWGKRGKHMLKSYPVYEPGCRAIFLLRDNLRFRQSIETAYMRALEHARSDALIANAYFFPGRRLRQVLAQAAARGVRVRLLLQGRSEYPMQYRACRYMYRKLLGRGIEIHEYMASYLHAKAAVIDNYATVGSSNLDPFSLLLAREANVFTDDPEFAQELRAILEKEMASSARQVTLDDLQKRSWLGQLIDALSYMMLRVGVALTGRASEYD
ncbi:cardiolipin synthase ClsB [Paracandidimonas soli]|uniref:cardiolipin synthase ClsB n=1 Tax=Paracandidimonas soli TaxID=1917182 RepID=UPI003342C447